MPPGTLDLTWKPTSPTDTDPPAGKAPCLYRGDTYAHTIRVTDGWLLGWQDFDWYAQLRRDRLKTSTGGTPLASFSIGLTQDVDDLLVTIGLAATVTIGLRDKMFWDMQAVDGVTVTTVLGGQAKMLDDVTRVA